MSKVTWLGNPVSITAPRPAPTAVEQLGATFERVVATAGGPRVKREYASLGDAAQGDVSSSYVVWTVLSVAGAALAAYHGYKRNQSTGAAVGWGVLGGLFPVITVPVALAQGYGKPKGASENPVERRGQEFSEVGEFEHEGQVYRAGGAFYDAASGTLAGYPGRGRGEEWRLQQFDGTPIVPLRLVKKYRGGFGRSEMWAWSATYDGRVFSGRNLGPTMFLRMRAGRSVK